MKWVKYSSYIGSVPPPPPLMTATAGSRTRDDELAGVDAAGNTGFVNGARFAPLLRLPPGSLAQPSAASSAAPAPLAPALPPSALPPPTLLLPVPVTVLLLSVLRLTARTVAYSM